MDAVVEGGDDQGIVNKVIHKVIDVVEWTVHLLTL